MEGEEERSEDSRSFSKASIPKRIAIVVAGATVNIIFAVVFLQHQEHIYQMKLIVQLMDMQHKVLI